MEIEDFRRLKVKIDSLRQRKTKAEGALEQAEQRLLSELGVGTVHDAEGVIERMEDELESLRRQIQNKLDEFAERWGEKLEEQS